MKTKHQENIELALLIGFLFDFKNQILITPYGNKLKPKLYGKQRYPTFYVKGKHVLYHKFCAYSIYGKECFKPGIVVRHLDGNTLNLNKDNIKIGTHSENNLDKPEEKRILAAKIARNKQMEKSRRPQGDFLTEEIVLNLRKSYKNRIITKNEFLMFFAKKYNVSTSCIEAAVYGATWFHLKDWKQF